MTRPDTPAATPAGPPPAAGKRSVVPIDHGLAMVYEPDGRTLASGIPLADAELLCSGPRLAALEAENAKLRAALELVLGDWTNVKARDAARAALGAAGPGGAK